MTVVRQQYDVELDGVSIRSLSSLLRVTGVTEESPRIETDSEPHPALVGQIVVGNYRREMSVRVRFVLTERFDLEARAAAIDAVNAWAQPGWLKLSYRPEKLLYINTVSERPAVENIKQYTGEYEIKFTAYAFPYWVSATPVSVEGDIASNTATSFTLTVPGNRTAYLEVDITPLDNASIESLVIETSTGCMMTFENIIFYNTTYHITYDANHILLVNSDLYPDSNELTYLTAASSDNLLLDPGANTITITADKAAHVKLMARGVFC